MVELMIVVAIIAVLASIFMPKMKGGRDRAALNACKTNLRHIGVALELYANDYDGHYTTCLTDVPTQVPLNYLTPNYLKTLPKCPLGNGYYLVANHAAWKRIPAGGKTAVFCYTPAPGAVQHPGLDHWCPYYWAGGQVSEN